MSVGRFVAVVGALALTAAACSSGDQLNGQVIFDRDESDELIESATPKEPTEVPDATQDAVATPTPNPDRGVPASSGVDLERYIVAEPAVANATEELQVPDGDPTATADPETQTPTATPTTPTPTSTVPPSDGDEATATPTPEAIVDPRPPIQMQLDEALGRTAGLFGPDNWGVTTNGVTEDAIRVAGLASETISGDRFVGAVCRGAEARILRANLDQELSRRIDIAECEDDGGNAVRSTLTAMRYQDDGDVFAIVPLVSYAFFANRSLNDVRMPYVGWGRQPGFCGYDNGFGFGYGGAIGCPVLDASGTDVSAFGLFQAYAAIDGVELDGLRVAYLAERSPEGDAAIRSRQIEADEMGVDLILTEASLPAPTDIPPSSWSALARRVVTVSPDVVIIDGAETMGLYEELLVVEEFEGMVIGLGLADEQLFVESEPEPTPEPTPDEDATPTPEPLDPDAPPTPTPTPEPTPEPEPTLAEILAGTMQMSQGIAAATDADGDAWEVLVADARRVAVAADEIGTGFLHGYASADFFIAAAAITPEPFSSESFYDAVNTLWRYPGISGVVCASWWPAAHVVETPCGAAARVEDGGLATALEPTETDFLLRPRVLEQEN